MVLHAPNYKETHITNDTIPADTCCGGVWAGLYEGYVGMGVGYKEVAVGVLLP